MRMCFCQCKDVITIVCSVEFGPHGPSFCTLQMGPKLHMSIMPGLTLSQDKETNKTQELEGYTRL